MSDLAEWLQARGFGQYAELFASNAIDREALVELTLMAAAAAVPR